MAHIDYERNVLVDKVGHEVDLSTCQRVLCPRSSGDITPGWIVLEYGDSWCEVLLEEKSKYEGKVRTKTIRKHHLLPYEPGNN